ncbi:acyl-CoA dehydrogenase family protein [Yinghuangia soli]|uniref:Acyl-CoA/acyl-ACP dehydrogenase n=1 Tax=Yinghuangia soli TaxID=2908204 RepID=A0AA41U9B1_9ACTN|nr:acyl-CoA dehydrogenase family protein [Yinghuangia soli]MCF2533699.1 acyl-CoA/acyl-ACP dehydrogenase [Yinghuangia soli]
MRFALSDEQHELATMARRLLADRARRSPAAGTPVWGERPAFDGGLWATCAELGLLTLGVPEELGGTGGGILELAVVAEEMGAAAPHIPYVPAAVAAAAIAGAAGEAGTGAGNRPHIRALVAEIQTAQVVALPAWETFAGLADRPRLDALRVVGSAAPSAVEVSGRITVPFGDSADVVVAEAAGPEGGRIRLLIETGQPGVRVTTAEALDTAEPLAVLECAHAAADVLTGPAQPAAGRGQDTDDVAEAMRVVLAAELVGTGRRALEDAVAYAKDRTQFGRPIGSFQALKHMLADRHVQLDAARMLVWLAAAGLDGLDGADDPAAADASPADASPAGRSPVGGAASAGRTALAAATDAADAATADGLQTHGGIGFTWEQPAHVFLKHARARRALLGAPGRQLDRLADVLLEAR